MIYFSFYLAVVLLLLLLFNILDEFDITAFEEEDPFKYMLILFWPIIIPFGIVFAVIYFTGLYIQSAIIKFIKKIQTKRIFTRVKPK